MVPSQNDFQTFHETFVADLSPLTVSDLNNEDREACLVAFRGVLDQIAALCDRAAKSPVGSWLCSQIGFRRARERIDKQQSYRPVSDDEIFALMQHRYLWFSCFRPVHEFSMLVGVAAHVGEFIHSPHNVVEMNTCAEQQRAIRLIDELMPIIKRLRQDKYFAAAQPHRILNRLSRFEKELPDVTEALSHTAKAQNLYPVERIDSSARERKLIADLASMLYGIHRKTFPAAIVDILSIEGVDSFQNERTVQKIAKQELDRIRERRELQHKIHAANDKYLDHAA